MTEKPLPFRPVLLPLTVLIVAIAIWSALWLLQVFPSSVFPSPLAVARGLGEEIRTGRLPADLVASLFRVTTGFMLAVLLGIPVGLWLGNHVRSRLAFLPALNFFRNLSPLAWIPFAILWFGIGDLPAVFFIFMACFFPVVVATLSAVASIPSVYFRGSPRLP